MADPPPPVNEPQQPWGWYRWGRHGSRRSRVRNGVLLILGGVFFLLANLGVLEWLRWDLVWPVGLIGLGIWLVSRRH